MIATDLRRLRHAVSAMPRHQPDIPMVRPRRARSIGVIAVYIVTKNMTAELHAKGREKLREAGALETAMKVQQ